MLVGIWSSARLRHQIRYVWLVNDWHTYTCYRDSEWRSVKTRQCMRRRDKNPTYVSDTCKWGDFQVSVPIRWVNIFILKGNSMRMSIVAYVSEHWFIAKYKSLQFVTQAMGVMNSIESWEPTCSMERFCFTFILKLSCMNQAQVLRILISVFVLEIFSDEFE